MTTQGQLKSNALRLARESIGHHVRIVNSTEQFNGKYGIVIGYDFTHDLYRIRLNDTQEERIFSDNMFEHVDVMTGKKYKKRRSRKSRTYKKGRSRTSTK